MAGCLVGRVRVGEGATTRYGGAEAKRVRSVAVACVGSASVVGCRLLGRYNGSGVKLSADAHKRRESCEALHHLRLRQQIIPARIQNID